ncbi:MAG: MerR family transcriptional regulator [Pseudomonadota bacterium]
MKIGTVADQLNIPASTIRYYEKIGLLEPQMRVSGKRNFDQQALLTLQFVQLAQAAGFSIKEIKSLLEAYNADPSPAGMWHAVAEAKRASICEQISDLKRMDRILTELLKCECQSLSECVSTSCTPAIKNKMLDA